MAENQVRILYVDDEESLALLGEELLGDLGYQVRSALSGSMAFELFQQDPQAFDLLITDESMPGITGIELAQQVYRINPQLPVVLCSGHLLTMHEAGMENTNVRAVLLKTEVCNKLPEIIEKLLAKS
ncbi:MAG TPA: response regulator [Malonomonas sp.]